MYADHTLTPKEAIRLCALGSLALAPMRYGDLAISIRHFISRVIGPTPEIMGHSLELLKYEGLVETIEGSGETALLRITDDGGHEMRALLTANVRPSNTELNTLITALKFRFLHLLGARGSANPGGAAARGGRARTNATAGPEGASERQRGFLCRLARPSYRRR